MQVHREFVAHRDNQWFLLITLLTVAAYAHASFDSGLDLAAWARAGARHVAWWCLGLLLFLPQEYLTHAHLLHIRQPRSQRAYFWLYRLHFGHHDHPKRHDLMYMPLWLTLPVTAANFALFRWVAPDKASALAGFCGALCGYLLFEWSHLLCHLPLQPRHAVWQGVRRRHLLHHHLNEAAWLSVVPFTRFLDVLLRTDPRPDDMPRSTTCRLLGRSPDDPWVAAARARFLERSSGNASASRTWLTGPVGGSG